MEAGNWHFIIRYMYISPCKDSPSKCKKLLQELRIVSYCIMTHTWLDL